MRCAICRRPLLCSAVPGLQIGPKCAKDRGLLPERPPPNANHHSAPPRAGPEASGLDQPFYQHRHCRRKPTMPTRKQKQELSDLLASNDFLTKKVEHQMLLLSGLQEQLQAATQMNIALLLKLGGSATLTTDDYQASVGRQLAREDKGDDFTLSVTSAAQPKPAAAPAHTSA